MSGHNGLNQEAKDRLRSLVDRIERLNMERAAIGSDIKDIFVEARSAGYDVAALRLVIQRRKKEKAELEERDALVELYGDAIE